MSADPLPATVCAPALNPMVPRPFQVAGIRRETRDTFTLKLLPCGPARPFDFKPGQFNMIYVFGVGEVPVSISGDPAKPDSLVHTIRDVGIVTHALKALKIGKMVGVRGPFGTAWPIEQATGENIIVAAGGLGLAPLRPILYHIASNRAQYGSVKLLYGAHSPQDLLFSNEYNRWRTRFNMDVQVTVNKATGNWTGSVGWITALLPQAPLDGAKTTVYACGPEVMMRSVSRDLIQSGADGRKVFVSLERNMKCAVGFCGHCMFGPTFICRDGPVMAYDRVKDLLLLREL